MRKVIMIGEEPKEESKGVEFTHWLSGEKGWQVTSKEIIADWDKLVYLGKCDTDGDMFVGYINSQIHIYKGNLNNGNY